MTALPADLDTRMRQRSASDPSVSAWVSANAGAGKTTVLRNRVLRLLLVGVEPGRILCLTFTKAAAAEMSNRVFAELARWVSLDDAALSAAIVEISGEEPSLETLGEARRLFARAIETPGGLRLDTIHGFCTRLLQAFAFEANVPARFTVLEEPQARELLAQAQHAVLEKALSGENAELFQALSLVGENVSRADFADIIEMALKLRLWKSDAAGEANLLAKLRRDLSSALGLAMDLAVRDIEGEILSGAQSELARRACAAWSNGASKDQQRATSLSTLGALDRNERVRQYVGLFLTEDKETRRLRARKDMSSAAARRFDPEIEELLQAEAARINGLLDRIKAVETRERTLALLLLAQAIRGRFAKLKSDRGALDFDDLIAATRRLLARTSGAFVLYKLDAAIEHLLVDEAQDTNSDYWSILRALTAEFTAGGGARGGRPRTIFAVGDEKQSIFGFQGAEPAIFGAMREAFGKDYRPLAREMGQDFYRKVSLNVSFRSTRDVLDAVDAVFAVPENFEGLTSDGERPQAHVSTRQREPGAVDLWPAEEGDQAGAADPFRPPDIGAPLLSAEVKLARRMASEIRRWTTQGCDLGRAVRPGDVLILVRRRGRMFEAVIRALKRAGVPVAGADRLSLSTHIAVEDLVAAGRAALLPQDDLTLAALLKSPFIGVDDDDLLRIAPRRAGSLRQALREAASTDARLAEADAHLDVLRGQALASGAFDFFARLLGPQGGRRRLAARLGAEAAEASDEVLCLALAHERGGGASLPRFLDLLQSTGADIKRDLSAARGEVRVMTVHGAKGLEAPIVILADACSSSQKPARFLSLAAPGGGEIPAWVPRIELDCTETLRARNAEAANRAREDRRLLYVAMTRARDRLVIAGCPVRGQAPPTSWYGMTERALAAKLPPGLVELPAEPGAKPIRRWRVTPEAKLLQRRDEKVKPRALVEPDWLRRPAPPEPVAEPPMRPSSALDAADPRHVATPVDREALLAGRFAHALLEHLPSVPSERRAAAARELDGLGGAGLSTRRRDEIVAKVIDLLADPGVAPLFSPESLAEVDVAGEIGLADGSRRAVSGRIDRLAVTPGAVLIADFKTGMPMKGRAHDRALLQLAIYRALIRELFPGRAIRPLLILLDEPRVIEPTNARLDRALALLPA